MKRILYLMAVLMLPINFFGSAEADVVYLNNSSEIHGNIVRVDKNTKQVYVQVVMDGELINGIIGVSAKTIASVEYGDEYKNLKPKVLSNEDRERMELARQKRLSNVEKYRRADIEKLLAKRQSDLRRREKNYAVEREYRHNQKIIDKRHQNRLELLDFSKENSIGASVRVVDERKIEE